MASANTLETVINFQLPQAKSEDGGDGRNLNRGRGRGANYRGIHNINFTSVAKLGLALRQVRMGNEIVGSYTGDKLTQRRVQTGLTFAQYGVGLAVAGPIGVAYAAGDLAYRSLNYEIQRSRRNQMASYTRELSGNSARNHSRTSGEKL